MQENARCRKVIYIGDGQGPENMKVTCMKTMHTGTMDRGFTVYCCLLKRFRSRVIT
jgi:hypothetical protein